MNAPVREGDLLAGKYLVERVIGIGGMGVVVAAHHIHLEERVAIKFLLPEALSDPNLVKRFLREGKAASKIRSEHVARVYDVGTLENGAPYIVMEFLEGSDLSALVKAYGPLPVATAVEYLLQACEAIAEAHAVGITHRDIKPSNLFLATRRDGSPVVKVIDFGISKMTAGPEGDMDITKTADARGSMLFMPPEQMVSSKNADPRIDIWALGVSLHYLLSRTFPFHAGTVPELCLMILQQEPTPLRAVRPDMPARLEACILRCLRKAPQERYANVAELAEALLEFAPPSASISAQRARRMLSYPPRESQSYTSAHSASDGRAEGPVPMQALPTGSPVALRARTASSSGLTGVEPPRSGPPPALPTYGADGRWTGPPGTGNPAQKAAKGRAGSGLMPVAIASTITVILLVSGVGLAWRYGSGRSAAPATSTLSESANPGADQRSPSAPPISTPSTPPVAELPSSQASAAAPEATATGSATEPAAAAKAGAAAAPSSRPSAGKGSVPSAAAPRPTVTSAPAAAPSTAPTPSKTQSPAEEKSRTVIF
ncbi:MAG TPA: serine/threonine-protein kinase [Polyangiaceae bacterium]|nr:serine/threonine-protein kinase [Polyangiaceae bacterium]